MSAAIVLQGLFLLVCHKSATCDIMVPHTPMKGHAGDVHLYQVGVGTGSGFNISWSTLDPQKDLTKKMTLGSELTGAATHPFQESYDDGASYDDHQFMLDGGRLSLTNPTPARNVITVPWPNRILAANRVSAKSSDVVKVSTEKSYIASLTDIVGEYLFSETVVLYYNIGQPFSLKDENSKVVATSTVAGATSIMLLSSWPPAGSYGDHSTGLDGLVTDKGGKHPTFQVTGIAKVTDSGTEDELTRIGLPSTVVIPRTARHSILMVPDKRGKLRPNRGHWHILTGTETGCGVISLDDGN